MDCKATGHTSAPPRAMHCSKKQEEHACVMVTRVAMMRARLLSNGCEAQQAPVADEADLGAAPSCLEI